MSQQRAPRRFDERWRLSRAGIVNVWHYLDNEFDLSGGRMILRGTNGSGKSRALGMLLPFLLDADRRRMDDGLAIFPFAARYQPHVKTQSAAVEEMPR